MSQVTTHVLDLATGRPAAGVAVVLERVGGGRAPERIASATTDANGRIVALGPDALQAGVYQLRFDTGGYQADAASYPEAVTISFRLRPIAALPRAAPARPVGLHPLPRELRWARPGRANAGAGRSGDAT
jgi:5-hydroxyisourate hydrolase